MTTQQAQRLKVGTKVVFSGSPAGYSVAPPTGTRGTVTTVPFGGGVRKSYLPGPGGGLLYVAWDDAPHHQLVCGVGAGDVERVK